jgi:hypothetical protein
MTLFADRLFSTFASCALGSDFDGAGEKAVVGLCDLNEKTSRINDTLKFVG